MSKRFLAVAVMVCVPLFVHPADVRADAIGDPNLTLVDALDTGSRMAAGESHSLFVRADHTLWVWGNNTYGQLGIGSTSSRMRAVPEEILVGYRVIHVAAGANYSFAITETEETVRQVWAWGENASGQLGIGNFLPQVSPVEVMDFHGRDIIALAGSQDYSLALDGSGQVWEWGRDVDTPRKISNNLPMPVGVIAAGLNHALALSADGGDLYSWVYAGSRNDNGQLGDGSTHTPMAEFPEDTPPVTVVDLSEVRKPVRAIACGRDYSLLIDSDYNVFAWGKAGLYLGVGYQLADTLMPTKLGALDFVEQDIATISAGYSHSVALNDSSGLWMWGFNNFGQLGDGTNISRSRPNDVQGISDLVMTVAGGDHTLGIDHLGRLWSWGRNNVGQLGHGTSTEVHSALNMSQITGHTNIKDVAAGKDHCLLLTTEGEVWGWGLNFEGQLGPDRDPNTPIGIPVPIQGLNSTGEQIVAGGFHNLALDADNVVWAWGHNRFGQLGFRNEDLNEPNVITALQGSDANGDDDDVPLIVKQLDAGAYHSLALLENPVWETMEVWSWGNNVNGELGIGVASQGIFYDPNRVSLPISADILSVSAGGSHSLALDSKSTIYVWGHNNRGQLGLEVDINDLRYERPEILPQFTEHAISDVSAGDLHSLALDETGQVWAWGDNTKGQLGDDMLLKSSNPDPTPVRFDDPVVIEKMDAGYTFNMALDSDGKLWAWGNNANGQLGDGTTEDRRSPVQMSMGRWENEKIVAIAAGEDISLALTDRNEVLVWGGGNNAISTPMSEPNSVLVPYSLEMQTSEGGSVEGIEEGKSLFALGQRVPITLVPDDHHHFVEWTGTAKDRDAIEPTDDPHTYIVTIISDLTLHAHFAIDRHTLTLTATEGGKVALQVGDANIPPLPSGEPFEFDYGTQVTVTALPGEHYNFATWDSTLAALPANDNPLSFTVSEDIALEAVFKPKIYRIEVLKSTTNDSSLLGTEVLLSVDSFVTPEPYEFAYGTTIRVLAKGGQHYTFLNWEGTPPDVSDEDNPLTLLVDGNRTLNAVFKPNIYQVTLAVSTGIGDTPVWDEIGITINDEAFALPPTEDPLKCEFGTELNVVAAPGDHYEFTHWLKTPGEPNQAASLSMLVETNTTLEAVFEPKVYQVSVDADAGGVVDILEPFAIAYYRTFEVTVKPEKYYKFAEWQMNDSIKIVGDPVSDPSSDNLTYTMRVVGPDAQLTANFILKPAGDVITDGALLMAIAVQLGWEDLTDLTGLTLKAVAEGLSTLHAEDQGILSLAGLEEATNLVELRLSGNDALTDIEALFNLKSLEKLHLNGVPVADLEPFSTLPKLKNLLLRGSHNDSDDVPDSWVARDAEGVLTNLPHIRIVDLRDNAGLHALDRNIAKLIATCHANGGSVMVSY